MSDKSSPDATDAFVFNLSEIISEVRREAKERKADRSEPLGVENEHVEAEELKSTSSDSS